jgi:protease I
MIMPLYYGSELCAVRLREIPSMGSLGSPETVRFPQQFDLWLCVWPIHLCEGALCLALWILLQIRIVKNS